MKKSLGYKKHLLKTKKNLTQEIIYFGLRPDRVDQTFPFETLELFGKN